MIMGLAAGPARLFAALLLAAVPPLLVLAAVLALAPSAVERAGIWSLAAGISLLAMAWAGIVAVGLAERLGVPAGSMLRLATGGRLGEALDAQPDPMAPVAAALAERNRQISLLAQRTRAGMHATDARAAIHHVVDTAREVTGDPVWVLAVLSSTHEGVPPGVYTADASPSAEPVGDVHRWAATAEAPGIVGRARHVEGPWGAFVAIDVLAGDEISATLVAPREGRPTPLSAEADLLTLIGEYAAATIEHSLLLGRVKDQAADLERLAGMQRDFLRGITHDLQAPLTSIRALATEATAAVDDPETADDLAAISHQADRLGRMVGQLLAMSRLEAGALEPRQEVFRPEAIIRRAWRALHVDRPFVLLTAGVPHLASGDPDRFEQVIWAVLDNAVRYSAPDAGVEVEVVGEEATDGLRSRTVVRDRGIGMSAEEREMAFERFYRSSAARSVAPNGSGIGLHTAQGLVRAMGGSLTIESRVGGGSEVGIALPAEEAPSAEPA